MTWTGKNVLRDWMIYSANSEIESATKGVNELSNEGVDRLYHVARKQQRGKCI
jgi:hypothetical protein